jgi:hypothetical protein
VKSSSTSTTTTKSPQSSVSDYDKSSSSEKPVVSNSNNNNNIHISKRSPNYRQKIAHPRILMKDSRSGGSHSRELSNSEVYDKFDLVSREFCQILSCPNYHTRLDILLKGSDTELNFASRCNFLGVAFFRALFRLKSNLQETWEMIAKIERSRGWVTPYNIRHNYSLPLRVDEVVFAEVPRLRKQLELSSKSVEAALRPIFRQEIILEWIEQNIWEGWKALKHLENVGETLKNVNIWPRRPVKTHWPMVEGLKLSRVEPDEL